MEYRCAVCQAKITGDMLVYVNHTETHVIDLIKHDHPDWAQSDGICQKCMDYYRDEIKQGFFKDAPCALRNRKVKKFKEKVLSWFKK